MDRWFTPQERGVILFLITTLLLGTVIYIYKAKTSYFAPELKILSDEKWLEVDEYTQKDTLDQLIQETETKLRQQITLERSSLLTGRVNINTAGEEELIALPGIGPVLAKRIIEYRERGGGFKKPEDIIGVRGIGQKKFALLKDKITI